MVNLFTSEKPQGITLLGVPYSIRFNCQTGKFVKGDTDEMGTTMDVSLLGLSRWWGHLGKTRATEWLQLFYVGAPVEKPRKNQAIPPEGIVCVSYIKTRSLNKLQQLFTEIAANGGSIGSYLYTISFVQHSGKSGDYYSVNFEQRERETEKEKEQLKLAVTWAEKNQNKLIDLSATKAMVSIDGADPSEVSELSALYEQMEQSDPDVHPAKLLNIVQSAGLLQQSAPAQ